VLTICGYCTHIVDCRAVLCSRAQRLASPKGQHLASTEGQKFGFTNYSRNELLVLDY